MPTITHAIRHLKLKIGTQKIRIAPLERGFNQEKPFDLP
jgi:hypothetical protein